MDPALCRCRRSPHLDGLARQQLGRHPAEAGAGAVKLHAALQVVVREQGLPGQRCLQQQRMASARGLTQCCQGGAAVARPTPGAGRPTHPHVWRRHSALHRAPGQLHLPSLCSRPAGGAQQLASGWRGSPAPQRRGAWLQRRASSSTAGCAGSRERSSMQPLVARASAAGRSPQPTAQQSSRREGGSPWRHSARCCRPSDGTVVTTTAAPRAAPSAIQAKIVRCEQAPAAATGLALVRCAFCVAAPIACRRAPTAHCHTSER